MKIHINMSNPYPQADEWKVYLSDNVAEYYSTWEEAVQAYCEASEKLDGYTEIQAVITVIRTEPIEPLGDA